MTKGNDVIKQQKPWLSGVTWDSILKINRSLCEAQKLEPVLNQKSHSATQAWWEKSAQKPMNLLEALDICRKAFENAPFTFNNGNTFANVARSLIEDALRNAPAVEAQILRSTVSHYVAGTIDRKELSSVVTQLASLLIFTPTAPAPAAASRPAPAPAPAAAVPANDAPAPSLNDARPVASS
jgi:hypothetical protein